MRSKGKIAGEKHYVLVGQGLMYSLKVFVVMSMLTKY